MKTIARLTTKNFWIMAVAALLVAAPQSAYALSAVAQQIQGDVMVRKAAGEWQAVNQETTLVSGDSIKTGKGTCSLVYSDQATFALEENTSLTVEEAAGAQDLHLLLGKIKGKVNHEKATQPFEVVTPAAVATVRGTEVDFGFNDQGQLTVDLHNGKIQVVNDEADMKLDLDGKKSITVKYDKEANVIRIKNECGSDGIVKFNVLGSEYAESPCSEREVSLATSENGGGAPTTNDTPVNPENPDEGRRTTDSIK